MTCCSTARRSRSSTTWLISSTFGSRCSSSRATEPFTPRCLPRSIWRFRYGKTWVSGTSRRTWSARSGGGAAARAGARGVGAGPQGLLLGAQPVDEGLAGGGAEEAIGQVEAVHRVLGVEGEPGVLAGDAGRGELAGERGAAHEERDLDAGRAALTRKFT